MLCAEFGCGTPDSPFLRVVGRTWNVDELFTLSQVSLLRLSQTLSTFGVELQFADIPFVAKAKGKPADYAA